MKNLVANINFEYIVLWTVLVVEIKVAALLVWTNAILLAL